MSSFSGNVQKEQMAAYVQELLSLDRARQRTMLDSLSQYSPEAQMKLHAAQAQAQGQAFGLTQGVTKAGANYMEALSSLSSASGQQRVEAKNPVKVQLPSGIGSQGWKPDPQPSVQDDAARLQQATQMLQAALANWEACVQGSPAALRNMDSMAQGLPAGRVPQEAAAPPQFFQGPPGLGQATRGDTERAQKIAEYTKMLEKALQNLNASLPRESAEKAQALLHGLATEKAEAVGKGDASDKLKWLAELLQTQNKASVDKMSKIFQDSRQQAALLASAAGLGMPLLPGNLPGMAGSPLTGSPNWAAAALAAQQMPFAPVMAAGKGAPTGNSWREGAAGAPAAAQTEAPRKGGGPKKRQTASEAAGTTPDANHSGETLRMHLRSLLHVDSNRVLIVRKINRLGFSSPTTLKEHFSWYGTVENVLVAHSRVKSGGGQAGMVSRLRPSGLGFVVMSRAEEADLILVQGPEQQVCGTVIRVQKFERRMSESGEPQEEEDEEDIKQEEHFSTESRVMGA